MKMPFGPERNNILHQGYLRGFLDVLNSEMGLRHDDFVVGRNTGRDEFPGHIRTLGKFGKLRDFLMVLDGDSRDLEDKVKGVSGDYGHSAMPLFLPGDGSPEQETLSPDDDQ